MQLIFRHLSIGQIHKVKKRCMKLIRSHSKGHFPSNRHMGPRCDRLSKMSSTHSSGGGRGHIEASGASWVSHPDFTKGFYYITQKFHVHSSLQHQRHETRDSSHFFQSPPGKIRLGYFFWVRGGQLLYDVPLYGHFTKAILRLCWKTVKLPPGDFALFFFLFLMVLRRHWTRGFDMRVFWR